MATSRLEYVGREMRAETFRNGACTRELQRGLRLELKLIIDPLVARLPHQGTWVLTLSRPSVAPGDQEVAIVRAAFGVPADAEVVWVTRFEVQLRWAN